jgi:hypothetical protein
MRTTLHKYFIPHHTNDYKPHFLRRESIHFLVFIVVAVFFGSLTMKSVAETSGLTSTILPTVLINLTNQDRAANSLPLLSSNQKLFDAAAFKANDMAANAYFAHVSPSGIDPWYWFKKAGYLFLYAGENLAVNFNGTQEVETAWMNSPGHRANILSANYREIGISTAQGVYQGKPTIFVVQEFGAPAVVAKPPVKVVETKPITAPIPLTTPITTPATPIIKPLENKITPTPAPVTQKTAENKEIKVVTENQVAIEVKAVDPNLNPAQVLTAETKAEKVSWFEKFFINPSRLMKEVYIALGIFILISMLLHIFIEIKHQHPPSILSGVLVLLLMFGLYSLFFNLFGATFIFV